MRAPSSAARIAPIPVLLLAALSFLGCTPSVRAAGHTVSPTEPPQAASAPAAPSQTGDSTETLSELATAPAFPAEQERPSLYADVPPGGRLIGKSGGIALEGIGRGGHWIAYCQGEQPAPTPATARGEALERPRVYLQRGELAEEIEGLLGFEESGRYLVILRKGQPWLIDSVESREVALSALNPDMRADSLSNHRSFAFTSSGLALLQSPSTSALGARGFYLPLFEGQLPEEADLEKSASPIEWGEHPVWRLGAGSRSLFAVTLPKDSTEKSWPVPAQSTPRLRCLSPTGSYNAFARLDSHRPDPELGYAFVPLPRKKQETLKATVAPGFVMPFQEGWVRRENSGRLLFVLGGVQKQITSANCGARILRADPKSGLLLVACEEYEPVLTPAPKSQTKKGTPPKFRFDLYLARPGFVRNLKADLMRTGVDFAGSEPQVLFPIRPGSDAALVDFQTRTLIPLAPELVVLTTSSSKALIRKNGKLSLWSQKGEEPIDYVPQALAQVTASGPAVAIDKKMFLLGDKLSTWDLPAAPLAVTDQGYVVMTKKAASMSHWPEGPLLLIGPKKPEGPESAEFSPKDPP